MYWKMPPQVGMSEEPCAATPGPKRRTLVTRSVGNSPPWRLARVVRSAAGIFSAARAGPCPLASRPWQAAQNCLNIALPVGTKSAGYWSWPAGGLACAPEGPANINMVATRNVKRMRSLLWRTALRRLLLDRYSDRIALGKMCGSQKILDKLSPLMIHSRLQSCTLLPAAFQIILT